MQSTPMLLMCSALITLVYSFPTSKQENITATQQNDTNILSGNANERPLVLLVDEKDSNSDSVMIEFVFSSHNDNSIIQTTGREKDKYVIENPVQEAKNQNSNSERKFTQLPRTQKTTQNYNKEIQADRNISPLTSLVPEEGSLLTIKWPKYFYETFNPVKPFPELETQKSNKIITDKVIQENDGKYILTIEKERKEVPLVAGPQLNPLSIYDREFYLPIFD